jgi:hypothetical protein
VFHRHRVRFPNRKNARASTYKFYTFPGELFGNLVFVRRLKLSPVRYPENRHLWRVEVPAGPLGRRYSTFARKSDAEKFFQAAKRELKRTKTVSFLESPHKLFDAIEALRMLEGISGRSKLRRAASLLALCCEDHEKRNGDRAKPYHPPSSRQIELHPGIFRGLDRIAREKGVDLNDLVAGLAWEFVRAESEKRAARHEYPREEKVRLRDVLHFEQGGRDPPIRGGVEKRGYAGVR